MVKNVCAPASVIDGKIYIIGGMLGKKIFLFPCFLFALRSFLLQATQEEWWHTTLKQTDLLIVKI